MKHSSRKNRAGGFTLVETIVAAMVAAIVGVVTVSLITLFSSNMKWSITRIKLQRNYDIVTEQIGMNTRQAERVLLGTETATSFGNTSDSSLSVKLIAPAGTETVYTIGNDNFLYEKIGAGSLHRFKTGSSEVATGSGSKFYVTPDRKMLTFNLKLKDGYLDRRDSLMVQRGVFLCRN